MKSVSGTAGTGAAAPALRKVQWVSVREHGAEARAWFRRAVQKGDDLLHSVAHTAAS